MQKELEHSLVETALAMRERAYAPYSGFTVGAALLTRSGEIVGGCNVENISYSATLCAERTAVFQAVALGHRAFQAIAVAGGRQGEAPGDYCVPCAMCLQVMREFCGPELEILVVKSPDEIRRYHLRDLLPVVFDSLRS